MENTEIICRLLSELKDRELGFTQKTDPTWEEPSHYYKLDEYGDLTDIAIKEICKEINAFIGDGAVDIEDAVDLWIQEAIMEYRIAYKDILVTKFKDKPVVDQIEAYESQALNENKEIKEEEFINVNDEIVEDSAEMGYTYAKIFVDFYVNDKENADEEVDKFLDRYIQELTGRTETIKSMLDYLESWNYHTYTNILENKLKDNALIENKLKDNALINNKEFKKDKKIEDYKRRLKEANNKSANLISDMFKSSDFDADSKAGQIVMRTSELFNVLSDKGYDVQVTFDNGESTSAILLGQQGGQVLITITNADQPLRAFTSGNFEINDENINVMNDIQNEIKSL